MNEINLSVKDDYHSQINNKYIPYGACMPTSFIMALKVERIPVIEAGAELKRLGWPMFIYPHGMQPEDYLMGLMRSPWGEEMRDQIPWAKRGNISPNQVHSVMSEAVNRIVGRKVTEFRSGALISDLFQEIKQNHPAVVSGSWTSSGHAVVVVGVKMTPSGDLSELIIDDPYGNYFTEYKDHRGNDVSFTVDQFKKVWAGWYHAFDRGGI